MWPLRDVQREFAASLLDPVHVPKVRGVVGAGLAGAQRVQIYRNHLYLTLAEVLGGTFPTVQRLVGERFFGAIARKYITAHPPARPCLFEYGEGFAAFLEEQPACRGLPYLADVARFEWEVNEAFYADDAAALAPDALAGLPTATLPGLTLALHPAVRLFSSTWPIDRIWRTSQPGADPAERVSLDDGGVALLVARRGLDVAWHRLEAAEYAFLAAIDLGLPLGTAALQAAEVGDFDLEASLARHLATGTFRSLPPSLHARRHPS